MPCQAGNSSLTLRCLLSLFCRILIQMSGQFSDYCVMRNQPNSIHPALFVYLLCRHLFSICFLGICFSFWFAGIFSLFAFQASVLGQRSGMLPGTLTTWSEKNIIAMYDKQKKNIMCTINRPSMKSKCTLAQTCRSYFHWNTIDRRQYHLNVSARQHHQSFLFWGLCSIFSL